MKYTADEFLKAMPLLPPADYQAAGPTNGTGIDTKGFKEALVIVNSGTNTGAATLDIHIEESADDSTYADLTNAAFTQILAASDNTLYVGRIKLEKRLRYLRAAAVGDGANAALASVSIILLGANVMPVSQVNSSEFDV